MMKKIILNGINSSYNITHITNILKSIYGVRNVWILLDEKLAIVKLDFNVADNKLSAILNDAGYQTIKVQSMGLMEYL